MISNARSGKIYRGILAVMLFAFLAPAGVRAQKAWKDLPPKQFNRIIRTNPEAMVIDTRMMPKYERERIPGAQPAPYSKILRALTDTLPPDKPLLIYCGYDKRSPTVCRMLTRKMGFENVFRLKGGLRRWKKQNLPLDTTSIEAGLKQ